MANPVVTDREKPIGDVSHVLSDGDVESFWENGYLVGPRILSDEDLAGLEDEADRVFRGERDYANFGWRYEPDKVAYQAHSASLRDYSNAWWVNRALRERIVLSSSLGALAARLMDTDRVRVWHDQLFWKAAAEAGKPMSSNIGWHQDGAYWRMCTEENRMLTGWVALRESTIENGCVHVVRGSHRWGLIPESTTFVNQDLDALRRQFAGPGREWVEVPMPLKPGQVSFHHSRTLHGSGPNRTDKPRLGLAVSMMPRGNAYIAGVQWHHNVTLLGPMVEDGDEFDTDVWPSNWPAAPD